MIFYWFFLLRSTLYCTPTWVTAYKVWRFGRSPPPRATGGETNGGEIGVSKFLCVVCKMGFTCFQIRFLYTHIQKELRTHTHTHTHSGRTHSRDVGRASRSFGFIKPETNGYLKPRRWPFQRECCFISCSSQSSFPWSLTGWQHHSAPCCFIGSKTNGCCRKQKFCIDYGA